MHPSTMNKFFHLWCKQVRELLELLSPELLRMPSTKQEIDHVMGAFKAVGIPGAITYL